MPPAVSRVIIHSLFIYLISSLINRFVPSQLQVLNGFLYLLLFQESLKDIQSLFGCLFGMGIG